MARTRPLDRERFRGPPGDALTPAGGGSTVSFDLRGRVQKWSTSVRRVLPTGLSLPDDDWKKRHRGIVILAFLHVPAVFVFGLIRGFGPVHVGLESGVIAAFA